MRLLIVRHGDPNYEIDSLTEKGWREASLLAKRLSKLDIKAFYTSPLGRAKDTARDTLQMMNREVEELEWLQEFFRAQINRPDVTEHTSISWDWLPQDWTTDPCYYDVDKWMTTDIMANSTVASEYQWVADGIDELLEKHGYRRNGNYYDVVKPNRDTIVLFCHFGVECVILSHLLHVSPMVLWHGFCAAPTSVTTIYTEERRQGIASFRVASFGDVSHLYVENEPPAFSARFCETYDCKEERHD